MAISMNPTRTFIHQGVNKAVSVAAPAAIGALTGGVLGVGAHMGLLQGFAIGTYYEVVHLPLTQYLRENEGEGKGKLHKSSVDFLNAAALVALVAVPFLATIYFGGAFAGLLSKYAMTAWLVTHPVQQYTIIAGVIIHLVASVTMSETARKWW